MNANRYLPTTLAFFLFVLLTAFNDTLPPPSEDAIALVIAKTEQAKDFKLFFSSVVMMLG